MARAIKCDLCGALVEQGSRWSIYTDGEIPLLETRVFNRHLDLCTRCHHRMVETLQKL